MRARRRTLLRATLGGAGLWLGARALASAPPLQWRKRRLLGFGTSLSIEVAHHDADRVEQALDAAVVQIRAIERAMSLFDPASDVSRLNRDGSIDRPDPHLVDVLALAREVSARSDGAFDVTVQPLWNAFAAAAAQRALPTPQAVAAARARVGWQQIEATAARVQFVRPGMGITLNGIAQGYAADRVRDVLRAHGIEHALIDAGEWATLGKNHEGGAWSLGIADPRVHERFVAAIRTDGRSIATSADDQTTFSDDHRYHHIFDPHTGYSPPALASVTVAARSCALADALTKVMFVAGPQGIEQAAAEWGVDVLWVEKSGTWRATKGLALSAA